MTDGVDEHEEATDPQNESDGQGAHGDRRGGKGGGCRQTLLSPWTAGLVLLLVFIGLQVAGWWLTTPRLSRGASTLSTVTTMAAPSPQSAGEAPAMIDADLTGAQLSGSSLRGANLSSARLDRADFDRADLQNAELQNAEGDRTSFVDACLRDTTWHESSFRRLELDGADLRGADLSLIQELDVTPGATVIADDTTKWPDDFPPNHLAVTDDASASTC